MPAAIEIVQREEPARSGWRRPRRRRCLSSWQTGPCIAAAVAPAGDWS